MDTLNKIISLMSKEEIRFYKLYQSRFSAEMRKDNELFNFIRRKPEPEHEEIIFKKLYGNGNKNPFYRLKNRLLSDLSKSITLHHFENDELNEVYYQIALSRFYFNKNQFQLSLYFLKKAERKAQQLENYELLEIIYSMYMRLSNETVNINPEKYIQLRKANREALIKINTIDDVLAAVTYRIKVSQNFTSDNSVLDLLEKTINEYASDNSIKKIPKLRFRIYQAVSQLLLQRRDYQSMEAYLLEVYSTFLKDKLFNKDNHDLKLQMLTYIVNALFKNKKLKESLRYAEILKKALEDYKGFLEEKYLPFYYNALVINYSELDKYKAISILEEMRNKRLLRSQPFYELFIHPNLAILWFEVGEFDKALSNIIKLTLFDNYKNADPNLKLRIAIFEVMLRYELGENDLTDYKLTQFKAEFRKQLNAKENLKEKQFITLLSKMNRSKNIKRDERLKLLINGYLNRYDKELGDETQLIRYSAWLREKMGKV